MSQGLAQPGSPAQTSVTTVPAADSVSELLHHLDNVRGARSEDSVRLLQELTPHLHAARAVERELDRHLARRFNVFRYLRDDELGLSRIIADLLDPTGEHGQGTIFLEAMMELLGVSPEAGDSVQSGRDVPGGRIAAATWREHFGRLRSTTSDKIRVVLERCIPGPRYIDVTVDIPTDDGPFCLALENKPRADDQPRQCSDYLKFLEKQYGERFLLVYLPPRYRMPDKSSLSPTDHERWKNHFRSCCPMLRTMRRLATTIPPTRMTRRSRWLTLVGTTRLPRTMPRIRTLPLPGLTRPWVTAPRWRTGSEPAASSATPSGCAGFCERRNSTANTISEIQP